MMERGRGEEFLHERNPRLHTTEPIENTYKKKNLRGEGISQKPAEKIAAYLDRLEKVLNPESLKKHPDFNRKKRNINIIKKGLHDALIIKPENIPENYFKNQRQLAREAGHGDIEITEEMREQTAEIIINNQKSSLDNWLNYLISPDSDSFPIWSKYWALEGMLELSSYSKEKKSFGKRDKGTVAPFAELNREALAYVVDVISKKVNKENISLEEDNYEFKKLLEKANFGKLYAWAIEKNTPIEESELFKTDGEWIKYDKNSDYMSLVESLQGHGTGWCTAGETIAEAHLKEGDFYVYYSHDKEGKSTIPRIAIRMQGQNIAEVRGVAHQKNIDPYIQKTKILDEKLERFGKEGKKYIKKTEDMKKLTEIEKKQEKREELSKEELRFLYEINSRIEGFGYKEDPRIKEIQNKRNLKKDISFVVGYSEEDVSITGEEALKGGIKYHYGDLDLGSIASAEHLKFPKSVGGGLYLSSLTSAEHLKLPESVGRGLYLNSLTSTEHLKLPESVGGNIYLSSLINVKEKKELRERYPQFSIK